MIYLTLFWEFCLVGLFSIGGGMATIPFLYSLSDKYGWFTYAQLTDMIAISESTPGPIGVNMATYCGFSVAGIPGSICATVGLVFPSLVIICIVAYFLKQFRENRYVQSAFYGLRPASTGLITAAGVTVALNCLFHIDALKLSGVIGDLFDWRMLVLAAVLIVLTNVVKQTKKLHPVVFLAFSALVGIVFHFGGA